MSPQEDDFSHYFNAVGRLQSENTDLQATIAQQQTRIEATETELHAVGQMYLVSQLDLQAEREKHMTTATMMVAATENLVDTQDELAAERERAEKAGALADTLLAERDSWLRQLQAEREKAARLEALAGLATEFADWYRPEGEKPSGWLWADDWLEKYDRLTTQAPEVDRVGGLMSIPAYQAPEAK